MKVADIQNEVTRGRIGARLRLLTMIVALIATAPLAPAAADLVCTDCHNPDVVPMAHDDSGDDTSCLASCHPSIDIDLIAHLHGAGTPFTGNRTTTCNTCHNQPFPGVYHPYRINSDAYTPTLPGIIDLDQACGQCHGGGLVPDSQHQPVPPALYRNRYTLSNVAKGVHTTAAQSYPVTFSTVATGLQVTATAYVDCRAIGTCPVFTYAWDWHDASTSSGTPATHTYATEGVKVITLTVKLGDLTVGTATRSRKLTALEFPPDVSGTTCGWNANTWTMTVQDASVDGDAFPMQSVSVDWGDGARSFGVQGQLFTHVPVVPGTYRASLQAIDTAPQSSVYMCPTAATAEYFKVSGKVVKHDGVTSVPTASVTLRLGSATVRTTYTASDGTFSVAGLKPGTYTLNAAKRDYEFPAPSATVTIGPSQSGILITATTP